MIVEGDASALGSYGIGIDESWGKIPSPDLYYNSTMLGWGNDPELYLRHFRRYVAAGAAWAVSWDFLFSPKLAGPDWDTARREVRQVLQDYKRVKDRMVHRFVHDDGSGYTWTNDGDGARVVWLLADAMPVTSFGSDLFNAGRIVLVLTDLTHLSVPDETRLSLVFSLTAAEAKLAKTLASGHGIEAAADSLRVNRETARTQLKAVFAKTNTRRQAELVALVARFRPSP